MSAPSASAGGGAPLDVVGIGNALVDVLSHESPQFVAAQGLVPGSMSLIDAERAEALYGAMGPAREVSGGSVANSVVGVTSFGGTSGFIGRVADDQLGAVFGHDIRAAGVEFTAPAPIALADGGEPTGRCLIVVTPDAQRTMSTFLGASSRLGLDDLDHALVARAQVLFLEGYLWDEPAAQEAYRAAARSAHAAGRRVAFSLSDAFCVDRHRKQFLELVKDEVDVLFANEVEITSLYEVDAFDDALQRVQHHCEIACLTRSEKGSVIVARDEIHVIDAHPVPAVVDTTGAGDLYAAGFLYGLTHGYDLGTAGRLGAAAAAEVIGQLGARPEVSLREVAAPLLSE